MGDASRGRHRLREESGESPAKSTKGGHYRFDKLPLWRRRGDADAQIPPRLAGER